MLWTAVAALVYMVLDSAWILVVSRYDHNPEYLFMRTIGLILTVIGILGLVRHLVY